MQSLSKRAEDTNCCNKIPVTEAIKTEQRKGKEEKSGLDFSDDACLPFLMVSQKWICNIQATIRQAKHDMMGIFSFINTTATMRFPRIKWVFEESLNADIN